MATFVPDPGAIEAFFRDVSGPVATEIARKTIQVDRLAKEFCAVDTGRLWSSISWRLEVDDRGPVGIVGTNVEYAPHQEFGTRYQSGTPFLRPAIEAVT